MPSGKQLSFAKGEVSQKERYKAGSVDYQTGLNKLRNMFVRKSGGVANLSGTVPISLAAMDITFQTFFSLNDGGANILATWIPADNERATIVRLADDFYAFKARLVDGQVTPSTGFNYAVIIKVGQFASIVFRDFDSAEDLDSFDLASIKLVDIGDYYTVTPEFDVSTGAGQQRLGLYAISKTAKDPGIFGDGASTLWAVDFLLFRPVGVYSDPSTLSFLGFTQTNIKTEVSYDAAVGYAKDLVRYEITAVSSLTNVEFPVIAYQTAVTTDGGGNDLPDPADITNLLLPYSDASGRLTIKGTLVFTHIGAVNKINIYRSNGIIDALSGTRILSGLVASFNVKPFAADVRLAFTDAGQRDISIGPPIDDSALPNKDNDTFGVRAYHACMYQGRLFAGAVPFYEDSRGAKAGEIHASKISSSLQFTSPLVSRESGAFRFNLPIQDGSVVVSVIDYNGLVAITEKACYAVMGNNGAISPSQTASRTLMQVGGSTTIKPVKSAVGMFYVNSDHSRIIRILHDNQRGHLVTDISSSFEHLLTSELVDIVAISGEEDFVFVLRADGKIIQLTINDSGVVGSSLLDLKIKVKNIAAITKQDIISEVYSSISGKFLREVLYYSGSNEGVWFEGYIPYRDDESLDKEFAIFDGLYYGGFLRDLGYPGYGYQALYAEGPGGTIASSNGAMYANIETTDPGVWVAGTIMDVNIFNFDPKGVERLKFFYFDDEGEEKFMQMYVTSYDAGSIAGATTKAVGVFDLAIPLALQNAWNSVEPNPERYPDIARTTSNFTPQFKDISYSGLVAGSDDRSSFILNSFDMPIYSSTDPTSIIINPDLPTKVPVSIVCDGQIQSSPLNDQHSTVEADVALSFDFGTDPRIQVDYDIALDDYYGLIRLGRPMTSEFETLDIESSDNRTLTSGNKLISSCGVAFYNSRGGEIGTTEGDTLEQMSPIGFRDEDDFGKVTPFYSGVKTVPVNNNYNQGGRIYIKNVDPVALTILSVYPKGVTSGD